MSTKAPVRVAAIALVVASAVVMSGCSALAGAPESVALSSELGWPTEAPGPPPAIDTYPTPPSGWVTQEGDRFWLVTWGSGSCVFIPTEVTAIDDNSIAVRFEQAPAEACTEDLAPRAHELAVPTDLVGSLESAEVTIIENAFRQADVDPRRSEWTVDLVGSW